MREEKLLDLLLDMETFASQRDRNRDAAREAEGRRQKIEDAVRAVMRREKVDAVTSLDRAYWLEDVAGSTLLVARPLGHAALIPVQRPPEPSDDQLSEAARREAPATVAREAVEQAAARMSGEATAEDLTSDGGGMG